MRTISSEKFVTAFAQHILPKGFQKIRHFGWMSSNSKISLDEVKWLTEPLRCTECGGTMRVVEVTIEVVALPRDPPLATFGAARS